MAWVLTQSPEWRFVVAFLDPTNASGSTGATLTLLDRLATNRAVELALNTPAVATGDVPSDSPEVNILRVGGGSPFLSYGNRFLYGFRREGAQSPNRPAGYDANAPYVPRFAGIIHQLEREAQEDQPVSHYTAHDPWQYWMSRPVVTSIGTLPGKDGLTYANQHGDAIVKDLLANSLAVHKTLFADFGQTAHYGGHMDVIDPLSINFRQGLSVGEALKELADTGALDVVLVPIYDLKYRPGLLVEVNVYQQAGSRRNGAIFGWDKMPRSLSGLSLLHDGTQLANRVAQFTDAGTVAAPIASPTSDTAATYGEYWLQANLQGPTSSAVAGLLAQAQADLRRKGKDTLTFSPAPERSPIPWNEYVLGDEVPVYASSSFGEVVDAGAVAAGLWSNLKRLYGMKLAIADDEVETVEQILTTGPFQ